MSIYYNNLDEIGKSIRSLKQSPPAKQNQKQHEHEHQRENQPPLKKQTILQKDREAKKGKREEKKAAVEAQCLDKEKEFFISKY